VTVTILHFFYILQVVVKGLPFGFAVSYIISVAINPVAMKLSYWTCSKSGA